MAEPHRYLAHRRRWLLALGALLSGRVGHAQMPAPEGPLSLVYPNMPERPVEGYGYRLLSLAMERAGVAFKLRRLPTPTSALRARLEVRNGEANVLDVGVNPFVEAEFDHVPFPLDLGLSGCRLLLVHREVESRLAKVQTLAEMSQFTFGQGEGWSDIAILEAAGLRVRTGLFTALFRMLESRRFDILPLGADEAHDLLARHQALAPSVVVAKSVALHYPFARVYAIPHGHKRLRDSLLLGLERAFDDGSLLKVLKEQEGLGPLLTGARTLPARLLQLGNAQMPQVYKAIQARHLHPIVRPLWPQ